MWFTNKVLTIILRFRCKNMKISAIGLPFRKKKTFRRFLTWYCYHYTSMIIPPPRSSAFRDWAGVIFCLQYSLFFCHVRKLRISPPMCTNVTLLLVLHWMHSGRRSVFRPPHTIQVSVVRLAYFGSEIKRRVYFARIILFRIQCRWVVSPKVVLCAVALKCAKFD